MRAGQNFEREAAVGAGFTTGARAIAHRDADRRADQGLARATRKHLAREFDQARDLTGWQDLGCTSIGSRRSRVGKR